MDIFFYLKKLQHTSSAITQCQGNCGRPVSIKNALYIQKQNHTKILCLSKTQKGARFICCKSTLQKSGGKFVFCFQYFK